MNKLDVWRWAQYSLVGLLTVTISAFIILPNHGQDLLHQIANKENLPLTLLGGAFFLYVFGLLIWNICISMRNVISWPIFLVYRRKTHGAWDHRRYRMARWIIEAEALSKDESGKKIDLHNDFNAKEDIPNYTYFLLEVARSAEIHKEYHGRKVISARQSCTMLTSILGSAALGVVLSVGKIFYLTLAFREIPLSPHLIILGIFVIFYLLVGLAFLQRNHLLVRDVLVSYLLRKEKFIEQRPISEN